MAAKGRRPLESCHLLEKVDENFAWAKPRGRQRRRNSEPNGRECQRGLPRREWLRGLPRPAAENFVLTIPSALLYNKYKFPRKRRGLCSILWN